MDRAIDHMTEPPEFPLKSFLGMNIERGDNNAKVTVELGEAHMNPNDVAHGAVPFAMMDTAMGGATMSVVPAGHACATIEMQTRFHRPAGSGRLTAVATILTAGKRIVHLEAKTQDQDGRLIASATGSFAVFPLP